LRKSYSVSFNFHEFRDSLKARNIITLNEIQNFYIIIF
jgi:hypothetical protein